MLWHLFWVGGYLLSACVIPFILLANKRPAATLAWIWAMILFPYGGPLFYLCFGSERMNRRRFRNRVKDRLRSPSHLEPKARLERLRAEASDPNQELTATLSTINAQPITTAETARVLVDGAAFYDALEAALATARKTIHIEFFIWRDDTAGNRFRRLLIDAARRGVRVRLLLDEMGSSHLYRSYFRELTEAGGAFSWFGNVHPLRNRWTFGLRNHRKLQIIDGETAFVGGMNMGCEYLGQKEELGPWHDIQVRVTGPVVAVLENTFADDWYFATDEKIHPAPSVAHAPVSEAIPVQVIEDGPDNRQDPLSLSVLALINQAKHRLWLTTAYFVPLYSHLSALKLAAARGVDVRMLISAKSEHFYLVEVSRSYYEELLRYGIRIFEFTEGINHGKVMAIDDRWASIGSANFDNRSMHLNFELNLAFHSPALVKELSTVLAGYYEASQEIHLAKFSRRPFWNRLKESTFRPLGPAL